MSELLTKAALKTDLLVFEQRLVFKLAVIFAALVGIAVAFLKLSP